MNGTCVVSSRINPHRNVGVFCFPKKLQGCNFWWIMTGPISEVNITGPVIMLLDQGRVFVVEKNKIIFGGMKFSYYIYINKHRHYG